MGLIVTTGSYGAQSIELGKCLNLYNLNMLAIFILSSLAIILFLICLIILIQYAVRRPKSENIADGDKKI